MVLLFLSLFVPVEKERKKGKFMIIIQPIFVFFSFIIYLSSSKIPLDSWSVIRFVSLFYHVIFEIIIIALAYYLICGILDFNYVQNYFFSFIIFMNGQTNYFYPFMTYYKSKIVCFEIKRIAYKLLPYNDWLRIEHFLLFFFYCIC